MAKKVVASLRNKSGIKYAKLIRSVKSDKTGAYSYKEEIVIEDHIKDILAGKSQQEIINELREKEKEAEAAKLAAQKEAPAAEAPKEEVKEESKEEAPAAEASKEEAKEEAPAAEASKEENSKKSE